MSTESKPTPKREIILSLQFLFETVSELAIVGKPVIFIPSPNVAEDHQLKNAKAIVENEAALLVEEKNIDELKNKISYKILEKDLVKILENPSIFSQVIELNQNDGAVKVILKEVQLNPSNDRPIHVDFQAFSEKTNITINVPLKFVNEEVCIGVKQQGGMISHLKNEIELTCNAQNLPEFIEIDMKDLEIGSNVMQSQIILPEGVSLSTNTVSYTHLTLPTILLV